MNKLEIYLPADDFDWLSHVQAIEHVQAPSKESSDSFGGLNRAMTWITKHDCAILTGWHEDNLADVNDANNNAIAGVLRKSGYGFCKCRGFYSKEDKKVGIENSFFTFDYNDTGSAFFNCVKDLSTRFDQDCFLYIEKGELDYSGASARIQTNAFLYGTSPRFIDAHGEKQALGPFHIGKFNPDGYTRFKNKDISFENGEES